MSLEEFGLVNKTCTVCGKESTFLKEVFEGVIYPYVCNQCREKELEEETGILCGSKWKHNKTGNMYIVQSLVLFKQGGTWKTLVGYSSMKYNGHHPIYFRLPDNFKDSFTLIEDKQ